MKRLVALFTSVVLSACTKSNQIEASGTIEFTQTDVAGSLPARVDRILVDEGATVKAGDTLVRLTVTGLPQDIEQRRARVAAAEAELRDLQQGARQDDVERARAELQATESQAALAAMDSVRKGRLLEAGAISQAEFDAASTAARVAASRRNAAREALELLEAGSRPDRIAAASAGVASARAQLAMAQATASEMVLTSPVDGQVLRRHAEAGEVLAAGVPVLSLGDARRVWVRVYVTAPVFAALHIGDIVAVTIDGLGDETFQARIVALATAAEFTPRVALTEKERADLLFGVKLELADDTGRLKAGLPATAHFMAPGREPTPNATSRPDSQP